MAERPYIVGNWKMNGTRAMLSEARAIDRAAQRYMKVEVAVAPPYTLIHAVHKEAEQIGIGAQDCHSGAEGAHTGDISAEMISDLGGAFVIVGHSERRTDHGESNSVVREKAEAALRAGITPIVCIGETLEQREAGETLSVLGDQITNSIPPGVSGDQFVVAYEPVWAIGTGLVPETSDIDTAHNFLRSQLKEIGVENADKVRLLYGGSVKPSNAAEILGVAEVNGALVGGASLKAADFLGIIAGA